jgi:hypothetical protein
MSTHYSAFGFSDPLKSELERLLTIQADLRRTVACLQMLVPPSRLMREAGIIGMALHTQALVSYVRCFTSGRRKGLNADIYAQRPDLLTFHSTIKELRDKHVAHAVGNDEHCNVLVAAKGTTSPAVGLGARYWFFAGGDDKYMKTFLKIAEFAVRQIDREVTATGDGLAKKVLGSRATWKSAQRAFYRYVSEEAVYGTIRHDD